MYVFVRGLVEWCNGVGSDWLKVGSCCQTTSRVALNARLILLEAFGRAVMKFYIPTDIYRNISREASLVYGNPG
jgi:hypothetical protein